MIFASFAALMVAQGAATSMLAVGEQTERTESGYELLAGGEVQAAIDRLEGLRADMPGNPALLLNLAAAYIQVGRLDDASEAYREAITSRDRMQLELADGSWEDSRVLARAGLQQLEASDAWAMR